MAGEPNLSPGDTGEWVTYLQQMLAHNGYQIPADGNYGNATAQALDQFQQAHNINTGSVDSTTWAVLTGESPAPNSASDANAPAGSADPNAAPDPNAGADPNAANVIHIDPNDFPILFGMHGVEGEQYVAALGIQAPQQGDDGNDTALA
jgi:peptidoglycan hydrolase-like protein with peptidoglycan-binding domain